MEAYDLLKIDIKALLQSAGKVGLTAEEIERDFFDLFSREVPYLEFGFGTLHELLIHMADVVLTIDKDDAAERPTLYYPISDERTRHLERLIQNQRVHQPTRFGGVLLTAEDGTRYYPRGETSVAHTNPFTGQPSQRPSVNVPQLSQAEINLRSLGAVLESLDNHRVDQRRSNGMDTVSEAGSQSTLVAGASQRPAHPDALPPDVDGANEVDASFAQSTTAEGPDMFPADAPILLKSQLPAGVTIPHQFWTVVYNILRDRGGEWMDIRQFQTEYARRRKKPLSTEFLWKMCGIKQYKQLFTSIPWIACMVSKDGVMWARLAPPAVTQTVMHDVRPRNYPGPPDADGPTEDDDTGLMVPPQPMAIELPLKNARIPHELRRQVYNLLWLKYRNGVDVSTFSEAYTKRFGCSLNTEHSCGMTLECTLTYMADLVDTGKAPDRRLFVRPVNYSFVKRLYKKWKMDEAEKQRRLREAGIEVEGSSTASASAGQVLDVPATAVSPEAGAKKLRDEIRALLGPYKDGLEVEKLATLYAIDYPARGIDHTRIKELLQLLTGALADDVVVFQSEIKGRRVFLAKLNNSR